MWHVIPRLSAAFAVAKASKLFFEGFQMLFWDERRPIEKRNFAPGQHGHAIAKLGVLAGYGLQLREKQKAKRMYFIAWRRR